MGSEATGRQVRRQLLNTEAGIAWFAEACREVTRIMLRPVRDGNTLEFPATLIGRIDGASLLVNWPVDKDGMVAIRAGERLDVKLFSDRDLIMFQVDVALCCFRPRPYLHLEWPREVASVGVREVVRVPMAKPARFARTDADGAVTSQLTGRAVDLSVGGAAFIADRDGLTIGEEGEFIVSIQPDGGRGTVHIHPRCAVRRRREVPGGIQYGIQFLEPSINDRLVLLAIVGEAALGRED